MAAEAWTAEATIALAENGAAVGLELGRDREEGSLQVGEGGAPEAFRKLPA